MMNTKIVLEYAYKIMSYLSPDDIKLVKFCTKNIDSSFDINGLPYVVADLINKCKVQLLADEAKATGNSARKKSAEHIIKLMKNTGKAYGAYLNEDGQQIVGCGYMAVRLNEPLPLQECSNKEKPMDFDKCIEMAKDEHKTTEKPLENVPSIKELKALIAEDKAKIKAMNLKTKPPITYNFGEELPELPMVRAEYLLDILILLGENSEIYPEVYQPMSGAIYIKSDKGDGVLMPMLKDK